MRILDAAISAEWAMEETALRTLFEIAARENDVKPEALEAYRAKALERADRARVRDGVAILNVEGPLFKKANLMTELCGATSYEQTRRDLQVAVDDGNVKAILLNVDSPGGDARGVGELAAAVRDVRGVKPIVAYAGDLAASAAYWIASAADRLMIGKGAALGSIGVRAALTDVSGRDAARGIKTVEFVSSQSPYKKADLDTKDGRARIQSRVDALAEVFIEAVAANRDVSRARVLDAFGKGDVLIGQAAIDAGMADGFGTFESVLAALIRETDPLASGGFFPARAGFSENEVSAMENVNDTGATEAGATEAGAIDTGATEAGATEAGSTEAGATETGSTETVEPTGAEKAVAAERERVAAIYAAAPAGFEEARDEAIKSGSSAATFSALIKSVQKASGANRASAIDEDTAANAGVRPSTGKEVPTGDDAAVKAILGARAIALGEK